MGRRRSRSRSNSASRKSSRHTSRSHKSHKSSRRSRSRSRSRNRYSKHDSKSSKDFSSTDNTNVANFMKTEVLKTGKEGALDLEKNDKLSEQKRLEEEMKRRRERIELWRKERKIQKDVEASQYTVAEAIKTIKTKSWTLEDDDDEDEKPTEEIKKTEDKADNKEEINIDNPPVNESPANDVDPLDDFMNNLDENVAKVEEKKPEKIKNKPVIKQENVTKKNLLPQIKITKKTVKRLKTEKIEELREKLMIKGKGEVMEPNQDVMDFNPEADEPETEQESLADALANFQQKQCKLITIDHSKMEYKPFKKDFYIEVTELARMTREQVKSYRIQLENIRVRGKDCPKPLKTWVQAGVSSKILNCLKKYNFEKPSPIQCQSIPVIMSGRDIIGIAKTGSGKTLAFLIPLMRHIEAQEPLEANEGPIALILTPTRELALQIFKEAKRLSASLDLRVVCVYGGTGISEQIADLKRGAEIIVCTPGRMIDMLAANGGRVTNLVRCTYVVLDEADRMFDLGFEPQVMRILENARPDRQTVMFSATFPRQMELLARKTLKDPIEVTVGGRSVVCSDVQQNVVLLTEEEKTLKLLELLGLYQNQGSILVFVDKQEAADELMRVLMKYGHPCLSLHGGIDQYDRDSVIVDFKRGNIKILIATSVAARGLDVTELILVVNYDCPNHYEDYVHRCGRTGRAGRKGYAYTFITPDQERNSGDIVKAFKLAEQDVPQELYDMWNKYKTRMEAEGKKVTLSSGFRGRGFHFDEAEAQLNNERKAFQKAALGLQDSDDETELSTATKEIDWDAKIEDMFSSKRKVVDVDKAELTTTTNKIPDGNNPALKMAIMKANQLAINKTSESNSLIDGMAKIRAKTSANARANLSMSESKSLAEQAASRLNAKLGFLKTTGDLPDESGPAVTSDNTVRKYEEELEINDFPQNVRWRVTSRDTLQHLSEYCEVGVSVRGIFIPPGKLKQRAISENTNADERPLYVSLEATSERNLALAKKEVMRIIKEELVKLQGNNSSSRGRYKVV